MSDETQPPAPQPSPAPRRGQEVVGSEASPPTAWPAPQQPVPQPARAAAPEGAQPPASDQSAALGPDPVLSPQPAPPPSSASVPPAPKVIQTLPPLPVLNNEIARSRRTGEPVRPALVLVALVVFQLAAAAVAVTYALHWWAAAHQPSYPTSARLIEWVDPAPGKWLALTLEGVLAASAALIGGACGVAGFQAWNGWRWSRWAGLVAVALCGALVTLFSWWGLIALGLAVVGAALLFLPPVTAYFKEFATFRATGRAPYRRPERIFYGRLPRYH